MWKRYFKVVEIVPGPVIIQGVGTVDFSRDDLDVKLCKKLYENDCRYLQLTPEGKKQLYNIEQKSTTTSKKKSPRKKK